MVFVEWLSRCIRYLLDYTFHYFERNIDAVQSGGSYTSRITSTLATRIEVRRGNGLQCFRITGQTHGATAAALNAKDNCFVGQETTVLAVEIAEALLQAFADMFGYLQLYFHL